MAWQEASSMMNFQRKRSEDASIRTRWCLKQNLNKQIEETKSLRAENDALKTENNKVIDNFLAFVDYMSCSADTYVSLGGSNGCADQLTNWDGTQKVGLGAVLRKKPRGFSL